jgi:RsiW-degrading membrane proteinase PrsW (M82 family)
VSVSIILATIVPLAALVGLLLLGRSWRRLWPLMFVALVWGVLDTYLVIHINDRWALAFGISSLIVLGAPIAEEITKALILPFLSLSRRVSWFVDGAVLGAAAGTGFAIRENWLYLERVQEGAALSLALARVTSTNLMHAGCTALIGAAIVLAYGRGWTTRIAIPLGGLLVAITLHSAFNRLTEAEGMSTLLITTTGVGVFAIAVGIVCLGFPLSARWVRRDLVAQGATASEQAALSGGNVADVLDVFESRYGSDAAGKAEQLVQVQRQLAIAHNSGRGSSAEIELLSQNAASLRRDIGMFAMMWLRSHLPIEDPQAGMWAQLGESVPVTEEGASDTALGGLWASLGEVTPSENPRQPDSLM